MMEATVSYVEKAVQYNGHCYPVYKDLLDSEKKLVIAKLEQLTSIGKRRDHLMKELGRLERGADTPEALLRLGETLQQIADFNGQSIKIQDELAEMMPSTLHNCFNLTIAEIDKLDKTDRIGIFLRLVHGILV